MHHRDALSSRFAQPERVISLLHEARTYQAIIVTRLDDNLVDFVFLLFTLGGELVSLMLKEWF